MKLRHRAKRYLRKTIAIVLGLWLGLISADGAFNQLPTQAYGAASTTGEAGGQKQDQTEASIQALATDSSHWYGRMIRGCVLLFVAAVVLGPAALSLKTPEPPERDEHDDHSHDAHAADPHAAHGGHGHAH